MIPSTLDEVDLLPVTMSFKIDRSKLPHPITPLVSSGKKKHNPSSPFEKTLIQVLQKHFSRTDISIDDNFFDDLGGHSLLAALIVSDLRKLPLFENMSVVDIYKFPVLQDLATDLSSRIQKVTK